MPSRLLRKSVVVGRALACSEASASLLVLFALLAALPLAAGSQSCAIPADYLLGPNDQLTVQVIDLEPDFADRTFAISGAGDLTLPHVGRLHAAGLTTAALESDLRNRLARILKSPQVVVNVTTYRSQPVSILGAVNSPGMRQIDTGKSLFEVLSLAGGLRSDAGYLVYITRPAACGPIPLPDAKPDSTGRFTTASIRVKDVMSASNPAENIPVYPGDTITIPKADVVYAVGSVVKPGGFLLNEHQSLSALQVLSLAEGLNKTADSKKAKIIRTVETTQARTEIPVDLKLLLAGKTADVQLQAGDILFIPNSTAKSIGFRSIDTATSLASGAMIYAHY